jgi:putative lipoprotein
VRSSRRRAPFLALAFAAAVGAGCASQGGDGVTGPEGREWRLVALAGGAVAGPGPRGAATLTLEADGRRAFGSGGCNCFSGGFERDGARLRFTPLAATKMACPEMATEDAYFAALAATRAWRLAGGSLELLDEGGAVVAAFEPAAAPAEAAP